VPDLRPILTVLAGLTILGGCASTEPAPPASPANYVETIRGTAVTFDMVWIPEGGFWVGRTEVTWDAYLPYCDFDRAGVPPGADAVTKPSEPLEVVPYDYGWGVGRRPAVGMSRNAAEHFCRWLSRNTDRVYRLPTEAEWELACGPAPAGPVTDVAWCEENSGGRTREVGRKRAGPYGLHDMLGNLWEYCADPWDPAEPDRAVLRGGSWKDPAATIDATRRLRFDDDWVLADPNVPPGVWWVPDGAVLGFRVVREGPRP
jgi:formylglycine-generating enzyme required for sulfatase activity